MNRTCILLLLALIAIPGFSQRFEIDTLSMSGPLESRINLVFLGDGYKQEELGKFAADARWMMNAVLSKAPYSKYSNYFNGFAIKVPSEQPGAANDPDSLIDNYFGSTFNYAGIWRLVVPTRTARVNAVLRNNFPQYDQIFMIVNDSRYGGSGGWIATATTHASGPEICIHELGHSFAGLSDEYWAGQQYARENINMTQESDPEIVKWKRWLNFNSTGIYPHAESPSWYRPHQNCEMRYLDRQFCSVCKEATVERILGMTNPVISYSPDQSDVPVTSDTLFEIELLKPEPNTLKTWWILNGELIANLTTSLLVPFDSLVAGINSLACYILDTTNLVRSPGHPEIHLHKVDWKLEKQSASASIHASLDKMHLSLYPNPADDRVTLSIRAGNNMQGSAEISLLDIRGVQVSPPEKIRLSGTKTEYTVKFRRATIHPGIYFAWVRLENSTFRLPFIINQH